PDAGALGGRKEEGLDAGRAGQRGHDLQGRARERAAAGRFQDQAAQAEGGAVLLELASLTAAAAEPGLGSALSDEPTNLQRRLVHHDRADRRQDVRDEPGILEGEGAGGEKMT